MGSGLEFLGCTNKLVPSKNITLTTFEYIGELGAFSIDKSLCFHISQQANDEEPFQYENMVVYSGLAQNGY